MNKGDTNSGFTLLEAVIATCILALVFSGFLISFVASTRLQYMSNKCYAATVIARNRTQYANMYPYGSLMNLNETDTCVDLNGNPCSTGEYWRSTSVAVASATVNPNCLEILVEVKYLVRPGHTAEVPVVVNTLRGTAF